MLRIRQSNRLDRLAEDLVEELAQAEGRDPLQADLVVVQSPGMATWLRHLLALRSGIAAGVEFPLPASLIWRLVRALVPEATEQALYDKSDMSWRLFGLLAPDGELMQAPIFATLADYLDDDDSGLKRHQLAQRIADVFDQYLVYRPDWMDKWRSTEADEDPAALAEPWQPVLWRALVTATGDAPDRAELQRRARRRLETDAAAGAALREVLPSRIDVFGLSAMPPEQLRLLLAVAGHVDVVMHVFNPCRGYWADIVSERYLAHLIADETARDAAAPTHPYYDTGHPLLGSLGRAGRDFVDLLVELGDQAVGGDASADEAFEAPSGDTALALLQADILELRGPEEARSALAADDESIVFADCHGPLREVEALHDWLLARFEADPELRPRDMVVMIPDVDRYAPCIETVFGAGAGTGAGDDDRVRIPFGISDRGLRGEAPVLAAVTTLLGLPGNRLTLSRVLGLLQTPAVMRAAGLDEAGLEQIAWWLEEAGVRWGRDAAHWQALGFPVADAESTRMPNSWAYGTDRLLLGYAAGDGEPFGDLLPLAGVEGSATEAVGALLGFLARLDALAQALSAAHDAATWSRILAQMLDDLVDAADEDAEALEGVRRAIADLGELPERCDLDQALSLDVITSALEPALQAPGGGHRFLAGQVTFCTLMPMRTIPFRIVALLGMNDQDYPRREVPLGFDLLTRFPRKGDRARRLEDRYLFLEALLAAREHLYISWSGRSPVDDTVRPASVVVAELRDVLSRRFDAADGGPALAQLTRSHALQPFSGCYDDAAGGLFTYASTWTRGGEPAAEPEPALPPPIAEQVLSLAALTRFLLDPAAAFLMERFDVRLGVEGGGVEDDEPFELTGLERYRVRVEALDAARTGIDEASWLQRERISGRLPHGGPGEDALARARAGVASYRDRLGAWLQAPTNSVAVDVEIAGVRVQGDVPDCLEAARLVLRPGKARERDWMRLWLAHLVLIVAGRGRPSVLVDQEGTIFAPVLSEDRARTLLTDLIEVRRQVLAGPAPLLCATSAAFGLAVSAGAEGAMGKAQRAWEGNDFGYPGEAREPAVARLWSGFPGADADLSATFMELAERVWAPLTALAAVPDDALVALISTGALPDE